MEYELVLDRRGTAVHYLDIAKLINYFPVGEKHRMALVWLLYGGRPTEIENLSPGSFWYDPHSKKLHCIWKPRKNQRGIRNEAMADWVAYELQEYFRVGFQGHGWDDKLFPFSADGLGQYIDKIRQQLGGDFVKKCPGCRKGAVTDAMVIQLKGLRKTFATTLYWNLSRIYGTECAVHMVSLRLLHSSAYMSCRFYVQNIQYMKPELDRWPGKDAAEIVGELLGYPPDFKFIPKEVKHKDQRPFCFSMNDVLQRGFAQPGSPLPEPEQIWDKAQEDVNAGKQKTLKGY